MTTSGYYLAAAAKYLLCTVSMVLTSLFALELSANGAGGTQSFEGEQYLRAALAIAIGLAVDVSKYLFWAIPGRTSFRVTSAFLVFFSWLASVAFFSAENTGSLEAARRETAAYAAHQVDISSVQSEIAAKQALLEKRVGSRYHEQWNEGEELIADIAVLNERLRSLVDSTATVGVEQAREKRVSSAFFAHLAEIGGIESSTVQTVFYGILALLIEICSLGIISLSGIGDGRFQRKDRNSTKETTHDPKLEARKKTLRSDIVSGKVRPVYRAIEKAGYLLPRSAVAEVLNDLERQGLLVSDGRKSHRLNKRIRSTAK